jgi:hypothetical protein
MTTAEVRQIPCASFRASAVDFTIEALSFHASAAAPVVSLEELSALDLHIWLRTGKNAARAARCNQSTISRRVERTLRDFDLRLARREGEWRLKGNAMLLELERELHQLARFLGQEPLRLEMGPMMAPLLAKPLPPGWLLGLYDTVGMTRPLQLLRDRVIDAWLIDDSFDLPPHGHAEIARLDLFRYPLGLAGAPDHPLAGVRGVSLGDLQRFPLPQLMPEMFPHTARHFADLGLSGPLLRSRCYDPADWEGRTADGATLAYATPFSLAEHPTLRRLDSEPLLINGVSLVVRRDRSEQPRILELQKLFLDRLLALRPRLPDLEPLN